MNTPRQQGDIPHDEVAEAPTPILRVVKGDVSAEELAVLVAVVAARNTAQADAAANAKPTQRSEWGHPARAMRTTHVVGLDAWHRSAFAR